MLIKKKKARPSLSVQLRRNNLAKFWYDEGQKLQLSLSNAKQQIEILEDRCEKAEFALKQMIDELVNELNAEQLEIAEITKYPPVRYALEWFKVLKYDRENFFTEDGAK